MFMLWALVNLQALLLSVRSSLPTDHRTRSFKDCWRGIFLQSVPLPVKSIKST